MQPEVLYDVQDGIATITFNRPERANAQTESSEILFLQLLQRADEDEDVKVVIVTGAGRSFCPGADMEYLSSVAGAGGWAGRLPRPMSRFTLNVRKPVVAAINGACAGSGLVYALMSDVRFASSNARFSTAFVRRGLVGERGLPWLMNHVVGNGAARELLLSGRKFDADEAFSIGLVSKVVEPDQLIDAVKAWCRDVADNCSPEAMALLKVQIMEDMTNGLNDSLTECARLGLIRMTTPDFNEGIASYQEGRKPSFAPVGGANDAWPAADLEITKPRSGEAGNQA